MRSIQPEVFELGDDGSCTLIGGYSPTSAQFHFPLQDCCPYTGATDVQRVDLSRDATLWGFTAVTAPPPGYTGAVPYGFGVVELIAERLRIITRLASSDPSELSFGDRMVLHYEVVAADDGGDDIATWTFVKQATAS